MAILMATVPSIFGGDLEAGDVVLGHLLEPDRLPDAGDRGVPDAARVEDLLAVELVGGVGGVGDADGEGVVAGLESLGDVERERQVAAGVGADFLVVDPDGRLVVDGLEVEQVRGRPCCGVEVEGAAVPEGVVGVSAPLTPESADSMAKGTRILPSQLLGRLGVPDRGDGVVPEAVEVGPVVAFIVGPRVLAPGVLGGDAFRPTR